MIRNLLSDFLLYPKTTQHPDNSGTVLYLLNVFCFIKTRTIYLRKNFRKITGGSQGPYWKALNHNFSL